MFNQSKLQFEKQMLDEDKYKRIDKSVWSTNKE